MAKYLMSVWHGPDGPPEYADEAVMQKAFADTGAYNDRLATAGKLVFAGGLRSRDTATCVDNRTGTNVITDGPFIESKENLGGFWIIEADDLAEALEIASGASAACVNKVEVRPFQ
ncbi:MAG TPA: YciI family protein [Ilumatobacter sp.]|nr:YciI family protein [Ilumatobacter sp.]